MLEVFGSWWHLTLTFDLESYFSIFLIQAIPFKWLYLATSFSVWRYIFRISRSLFRFKVMGLRSRSRQWKSGSLQIKNYLSEMLGLYICYDNVRSNLELLTFWSWHLILFCCYVSLNRCLFCGQYSIVGCRERPPLKWPVMCWVGCKTVLTYILNVVINYAVPVFVKR